MAWPKKHRQKRYSFIFFKKLDWPLWVQLALWNTFNIRTVRLLDDYREQVYLQRGKKYFWALVQAEVGEQGSGPWKFSSCIKDWQSERQKLSSSDGRPIVLGALGALSRVYWFEPSSSTRAGQIRERRRFVQKELIQLQKKYGRTLTCSHLECLAFDLLAKIIRKKIAPSLPIQRFGSDTILLDSFYLFSLGAMGWILDFTHRIKKRNLGHVVLAVDALMMAAPDFLSDLKGILGRRLDIVWLKKTINLQDSFNQMLASLRLLRGAPCKPEAWEACGISVQYNEAPASEIQRRNRANKRGGWEHSFSWNFQKVTNDYVLFHLRQDEFRGWKSPRSGLPAKHYNEFFAFLGELGLRAFLLSSSPVGRDILAESIPDLGVIRADDQLRLVKNAFMIFGSYSGPTHLGPGYGIPTVNFDLPWPLTWLNHGKDLFLLKGIQDSEGNRFDPGFHYRFRPDFNPDADGELPIQKAGYQLIPNTSEEMMYAFLEMLLRQEKAEETRGRRKIPNLRHSLLRKKILGQKAAENKICDLLVLGRHKRKSALTQEGKRKFSFDPLAHSYGTSPLPFRQLAAGNWTYALQGVLSNGTSTPSPGFLAS